MLDADSARKKARDALSAGDAEHAYRRGAPALLDLVEARTLVPLTLAVVAWALVELDLARRPGPLDALDLALRMVAFAATVRAFFELASALLRHREAFVRRDDAIVMLEDALVVFASDGDRVIPRADVAGVHGGRDRDGRDELLLFVRPPSAPALLRLPTSVATPAGVAASRIERWAGLAESPTTPLASTPASRTPVEDYDRIAGGGARPGETSIPSGWAWLGRGPYAAAAFVLVLAERALHLPTGSTMDAPILAVAALCVLLPLGWLALGLRRIRQSKGAALVCTTQELLVRHPRGVHRVPYVDLGDVRVHAAKSWTLLSGVSVERSLVIERADHANLRIDERLLRHSAPAVRALLEAYGRGAMAASGTPASQGSGAGGGISSSEGTTT